METAEQTSDQTQKPLTVSQVIEALRGLDQDSVLYINIRQRNKAYGVVQMPLVGTTCISSGYGGSITVCLPEGAYLAGLPKL